MSKKKHHHEEHEEHVNHEAWVIPYADMLTLLMALFLVMWAGGQADAAKAKVVSSGFAESLGIHSESSSGGDGILDGVRNTSTKVMPTKAAEALAALAKEESDDAASARSTAELKKLQDMIYQSESTNGVVDPLIYRLEPRGLVVSIVAEGVLFDAGSADLRPEGLAVLDGLIAPLLDSGNRISIEGHTDNRPISTDRFPSNWELSTARASAVLRYMVDVHGVDPARLSAAGYADQQPVADNGNELGRARNRRVDVAISSSSESLKTERR